MSVRQAFSESAIHGVILFSGLLVIVANQEDAATTDILVKVIVTAVVFWLAEVYAGTVAHLGDHHDEDLTVRQRLGRALVDSLGHSWGMLVAALVPAGILLLGVTGAVSHRGAVWGSLWVDVVILAVFGAVGVSAWSRGLWPRVAAAVATGALGVALIALKAFIH